MPYKDPEKRRSTVEKSRKTIYELEKRIQIRRDSGMTLPLLQASNDASLSVQQYMIEATREKLIRDGYMPAPDDEGEPSV